MRFCKSIHAALSQPLLWRWEEGAQLRHAHGRAIVHGCLRDFDIDPHVLGLIPNLLQCNSCFVCGHICYAGNARDAQAGQGVLSLHGAHSIVPLPLRTTSHTAARSLSFVGASGHFFFLLEYTELQRWRTRCPTPTLHQALQSDAPSPSIRETDRRHHDLLQPSLPAINAHTTRAPTRCLALAPCCASLYCLLTSLAL